MKKNYYDILGVKKTATQDEIKKAYRELCKKYHPDRTGGDDSKIKEINEAYAVIGDESKRKEYDGKSSIFNIFGNGNWSTGYNFNFNNLAADYKETVTVTFEEAYKGCKRQVIAGGKIYTIDIPKGTTNGKPLKIVGLGKSGVDIHGNPATGDLIVTVIVKNDDRYSLTSMVNGTTMMEVMYAIDWIDAILGGETTVKIFDRDVTVRVPKFTQNGGYTIVGNQGFPKFKSDELGPLKVNFIVRMPKSLNDEQMEALRKIKESLK